MEFVAKLDDQITPGAEPAAASLGDVVGAAKGADAGLKTVDETQKKVKKSAEDTAKAVALQVRALDSAQRKGANRAELQAKAFNPEAYKKQILAEKALADAKEKALQGLGIGRSKKEQDEKKSAEEAEKEKRRAKEQDEKAKNAAKKQRGADAGAGLSSLAGQVKAATVAFVGLAGASSLLDLSKIAIGYAGLGRLQMITQRATLNFRQLFRGVDSKPLERAYLRLTDMFSMSSVSGRAISGVLTRSFNSFFASIEKAVPYVETFFQTLLLGGLKAEGAWLRARLGLLPFTSAIGQAIDRTAVMRVTAVVAAAGLAYVGVAAVTAAAPFLAFAAAVAAAVAAFDQLNKVVSEWDGDVILRSLGIGESDADKLNRKYDEEAAARRKTGKPQLTTVGELPTSPRIGPPSAAEAAASQRATTAGTPGAAFPMAAGLQSGLAMGAGLVAGLSASEAAARAAGVGLAKAAEGGVRAEAEIHSPARKLRRDGQYMGQGTELGIRDSAPAVQKAAAESLVPAPRAAARAGAGGESGIRSAGVVNLYIGHVHAGAGKREEVQDGLKAGLAEIFFQAEIALGGARA